MNRRGPTAATIAKYAEVARIASEVHGKYPIAVVVADRFGVPRKQATNLISAARKFGHDIPTDFGWHSAPHSVTPRGFKPQPFRSSRSGMVLVCSCGRTFKVEDGSLFLARHTWMEHERRPSPCELTPQLEQAAA